MSGPTAPTGQIARALAVMEAVAINGSSTAKAIAEHTGIPLPTVYRIAHELIDAEYLVHLRTEGRFALGYQLHRLAVGLHHDLGVPPQARDELRALCDDLGMASYLAVHRGADFVVVVVADAPRCPRLQLMDFGFHQFPHATAFGKLGLACLDGPAREAYLNQRLTALTEHTVTDPAELRSQLAAIAAEGVAWERDEFQPGAECLAVPIKADDGALVGSVAVSAPSGAYSGRRRHVEQRVRACAARAGRAYRYGKSAARFSSADNPH